MAKQKKTSYKWLYRLIDRITKSDAPNNNYFDYYGHHVNQLSGTVDYTSVTIYKRCKFPITLLDFSFDYWTKELVLESYPDYEIRNALVDAFLECYGNIRVTDTQILETRKEYEEYINNPDEYIEDAVNDAREELKLIEMLPMGWVTKTDIDEFNKLVA
mgnify:CR=1 FL=1